MRKLMILLAGLILTGALAAPASARVLISGGLGIGYAGPYAYGYPYPYPAYPPPGYYPPPAYYYPPAYYAPPYIYPPGAYWPDYGPDIAVRWNRYFTPEYPAIRGYTLPR